MKLKSNQIHIVAPTQAELMRAIAAKQIQGYACVGETFQLKNILGAWHQIMEKSEIKTEDKK